MRDTSKRFGRGGAKFVPEPKVLVICEDTKSGKRYIEDVTKALRVHVEVLVMHCGRTDPKGIVEEAFRQAKNFDQVFCAIDRDTHENFDEAMRMARADPRKIKPIVSYPCMEFWYLLHFGFTRRAYAREGNKSPGARVIDDLRKIQEMTGYEKGQDGSIYELLRPRLDEAKENSRRVLLAAINENEMNPSSEMHLLLAFFETLTSPRPI